MRLCCALALLLVLASTPVAHAQGQQAPPPQPPAQEPYLEGELESGSGINCTSLIFPPARIEMQIMAGAARTAAWSWRP